MDCITIIIVVMLYAYCEYMHACIILYMHGMCGNNVIESVIQMLRIYMHDQQV